MKKYISIFCLLITTFFISSVFGDNFGNCELLNRLASTEAKLVINNATITYGGWASLHEIAADDAVIAYIAVVNHSNLCYPIDSPIDNGIFLVSEVFHLIDGVKNECILSEHIELSIELGKKLQVNEQPEMLGVDYGRYCNALKAMFVDFDNSSFDFVFEETAQKLKNASNITDYQLINTLDFYNGTTAYKLKSEAHETLLYLFCGVFSDEPEETFWVSLDEDLRYGLQLARDHFLVQKFLVNQ